MKHLPRLAVFATSVLCLSSVVGQTAPTGEKQPSPAPDHHDHRVVVCVWDGLRPDSVNEQDTPTLAKLAREGVFFTRHHPAYPSSTEVNGTAIATGCYPATSGIIANREYRPDINPSKAVDTEVPAIVKRGDEVSGGHYLRRPTLAERLQARGERTVIAGTKNVVLLHDRGRGERDPQRASGKSVTLFGGATLPPEAAANLAGVLGGPFPTEIRFPNQAPDVWTTRALTEVLWKDGPPRFSVLWLSDPDYTQHQHGVGSPPARAALSNSDASLATVLKALEAGGWRGSTDVFVVSDHGFSTIGQGVDVARVLAEAGFHAGREIKGPPQEDDVLVTGLGGSVYLYVVGHRAETVRRVVEFLQGTEFAGAIFTRQEGVPGTFPLAAVHIDSPAAPDIALGMRWMDMAVNNGPLGLITNDGGRRPGQGTHASLSRYDMHNTLVANGPSFAVGLRDEYPSGNTDLAPTIAHLLGLPADPPFDGRVLREAFRGVSPKLPPVPEPERRDATGEGAMAGWRQYLQVTRFGGVDYIDEANAMPPSRLPPVP